MSRHEWRCRNPSCATPHGLVLGRLTADNGLVLDPSVRRVSAYFDTRKAVVVCPVCGTSREFRGSHVVTR